MPRIREGDIRLRRIRFPDRPSGSAYPQGRGEGMEG